MSMTELEMCCGTCCDKRKLVEEFEAIKKQRDIALKALESVKRNYNEVDGLGFNMFTIAKVNLAIKICQGEKP